MCLKSITRVIENPTLNELVGYKVVFIRDEKIQPAYHRPDNNPDDDPNYSIPTNIWLIATPHERYTYSLMLKESILYQTGFHIFTTLNGAKTWRRASHVIQVKYRLVTYHGTEAKNRPVHIAREMYIPWPQTPIEIK